MLPVWTSGKEGHPHFLQWGIGYQFYDHGATPYHTRPLSYILTYDGHGIPSWDQQLPAG